MKLRNSYSCHALVCYTCFIFVKIDYMKEVSFTDGILIKGGFLSVGGGILDFCKGSVCCNV